MLDFLVCSLLLFVIGTGGRQTQFATSARAPVHEAFSAAAMENLQEEWNRDYDQQQLVAQLNAETTEKEQLRQRLTETSETLAERTARLGALTEEKTRVEQALTSVESQLGQLSAERERLRQEGAKARERLTQLQGEQQKLQQEKTELSQRAEQLGQTVVSQQETISALAEGVRASQERIETQIGEFARENENVAALAAAVKELQAEVNPQDRAALMQAISGVQSQLQAMASVGTNNMYAENLEQIQTGQEELRQQTARIGDQIEAIRAKKPGPYQAVRSARTELLVKISKRDSQGSQSAQFRTASYPPVVRVDGRALVVAYSSSLGFAWPPLASPFATAGEVTELNYTIHRAGATQPAAPLTAGACVLKGDSRVAVIELSDTFAGMELADSNALFQSDQSKLHVFKCTAAGLSFEVDVAPDLADARYLIIKRPLRGVAAWFENPAYRAQAGDYVVTSDGKLAGLMVDRERCFLLTREAIDNCATTIPLGDRQEFPRAVKQLARAR
jgi:predicted  nucleic acid-binding Zn-ribbon protein